MTESGTQDLSHLKDILCPVFGHCAVSDMLTSQTTPLFIGVLKNA